MKFSLLAVGQQFEYQGESYIKSTPLIAHHVDTGEQKLIPRSATVTMTGSASAAGQTEKQTIKVDELLQAFTRLETELQGRLESDVQLGKDFAEAKQNFFHRLGITPAK